MPETVTFRLLAQPAAEITEVYTDTLARDAISIRRQSECVSGEPHDRTATLDLSSPASPRRGDHRRGLGPAIGHGRSVRTLDPAPRRSVGRANPGLESGSGWRSKLLFDLAGGASEPPNRGSAQHAHRAARRPERDLQTPPAFLHAGFGGQGRADRRSFWWPKWRLQRRDLVPNRADCGQLLLAARFGRAGAGFVRSFKFH